MENIVVEYTDIVHSKVDKETLKEIDKIVRQNQPHIEQDLPKVNNEITEFDA